MTHESLARDNSEDDELRISGQTIDRTYKVLRCVGSGGFGIVYEALHIGRGMEGTQQSFRRALKFLRVNSSTGLSQLLRALRKEADLLEKLSQLDAGIVQAHEVRIYRRGATEIPYLVMAWLDGETLASYIEKLERPLELNDALLLLDSAAKALATAHKKGVAHRDVKPANLFLVGDGDDRRLKVLDFGLANASRAGGVTEQETSGVESRLAFTPRYAAPEQFAPDQFGATGPHTDVFALALVLVELVTGNKGLRGSNILEFHGASVDQQRRPTPGGFGVDLGKKVEEIFSKAVAIDPKHRYANVGAFWAELLSAAKPRPNVAVRRSTPPPITRTPVVDEEGATVPTAPALFYAYDSTDEDFRGDLEQAVRPAIERSVTSWNPVRVTAGNPDTKIPDGSVLIILLTTALHDSGYCYDDAMRELLQRHRRGAIRIVPVLIDRIRWRWQRPFDDLVALPRFSIPISKWPDPRQAWADVTASLGAILRDPRGSEPRRRASLAGTIQPLHSVFKKSGTPKITFVETEAYKKLVRCLREPGRGIVVEGPSGVGKTTALMHAIAHVRASSNEVNHVEQLTARNPEHVKKLQSLAEWHKHGTIAIDDFHRLFRHHAPLAAEIADHMKNLADLDSSDKKVVIAGVPGSGQALIEFGADLAMRIDVLRFGPAHVDDVYMMIVKGEQALNISLERKSDIAVASAGSFNIAQFMCAAICELSKIDETMMERVPVTWSVTKTIESMVTDLKRKVLPLVVAFGRIGKQTDLTSLRILQELPACEDGHLLLSSLMSKCDASFAQAMDDILPELAQTLAADSQLEDLVFYSAKAEALVVEDPQVLFYLAYMDLRTLCRDAGKRYAGDRARICLHYSVHDADLVADVRRSLRGLEDREMDLEEVRVMAGTQWRPQSEKMFQDASVVLLFVSPDYLTMIQRADVFAQMIRDAAERRVLVLPILLKQSPRYANSPIKALEPVVPEVLTELRRGDEREAVGRKVIERIRNHFGTVARQYDGKMR